MEYAGEYDSTPYPGYKPPTHPQARLLLAAVIHAAAGVVERTDANVVFNIGLGYASNAFPEAYALKAPEHYTEQIVQLPYGPSGQPISPVTGAG